MKQFALVLVSVLLKCGGRGDFHLLFQFVVEAAVLSNCPRVSSLLFPCHALNLVPIRAICLLNHVFTVARMFIGTSFAALRFNPE